MNTSSAADIEKVVMAQQAANLTVQSLRELMKADNPLLAETGIDLLEKAVQLEQKLGRIRLLMEECQ